MSRPLARRATLEELAVLRDQGRAVELVDGEIVEKAMPLPEHGAAQTKSEPSEPEETNLLRPPMPRHLAAEVLGPPCDAALPRLSRPSGPAPRPATASVASLRFLSTGSDGSL